MYNHIFITVEPMLGSNIVHVCRDVSELSSVAGVDLSFEFNNVKVFCRSGMTEETLITQYHEQIGVLQS
jgi:hypothetical protein